MTPTTVRGSGANACQPAAADRYLWTGEYRRARRWPTAPCTEIETVPRHIDDRLVVAVREAPAGTA